MKRFSLLLILFTAILFSVRAQSPYAQEVYAEISFDETAAHFTTESVDKENVDRKALALEAMRKPTKPMFFHTNHKLKVVIWTSEIAQATIKIHTAEGKLVRKVENYLVDDEKNEILIPVQDLATGDYWVSFFKNDTLLSSKHYTKH